MKKLFLSTIMASQLTISPILQAEQADKETPQNTMQWSFAPVLAYNPDYGVVAGAAAFSFPSEAAKAAGNDYYFQTIAAFAWGGIANIDSQFSQWVTPQWQYRVQAEFDNFQQLSYLSDGEQVKIDQWKLAFTPELHWKPNAYSLFAGADYEYKDVAKSPEESYGFADDNRLTSFIGAAFDNRDNDKSTENGSYVNGRLSLLPEFTSFLANENSLGHSAQVSLDARHFISFGQQTLGARAVMQQQFGDQLACTLGGSWSLRGYGGERFRGDRCLMLQSEYRFPIWRFISGVAFATGANIESQESSDTVATTGLGFRFGLPPDGSIKIRTDLGVTDQGDFNFYVNFNQVF